MSSWEEHRFSRMSAMQLAAAITLVVLATAILVAAHNVAFSNTTTTVITTVIRTTTNNRTKATKPPAPIRNRTVMTSAATPTKTSSRLTTQPTLSATWGPLMYCWFPCYGGGCGGYPLPQNRPSGGTVYWWFGFPLRWPRIRPNQGCPCPTGGCNRRRTGC